ncbi:MAG: hypothetical protein ACP5TX_05565, partial [Thermoplasmata archaeon]
IHKRAEGAPGKTENSIVVAKKGENRFKTPTFREEILGFSPMEWFINKFCKLIISRVSNI